MLKPAMRRMWRDGSTVQLGLDPCRAVLIHDVTPAVLGALDLMDGTRRPEDVVADAQAGGLSQARAEGLMQLLTSCGALDDAGAVALPGGAAARGRLEPELASLSLAHPAPGLAETLLLRRAQAHVRVVGASRVGAAVARLLAAAGVGGVAMEDHDHALVRAADVLPGGCEPSSVGSNAAASVDLPAPRPGSVPDLVVLAPTGAAEVPLAVGERWRRDGVAHLGVRVREVTGVIGPLVLPGRTACLTCLHLHRTDRDPRWPLLAVQLAGSVRDADPGAAALCSLVAAAACLQVLEFLDAAPGSPCPASAGGTIEITPPDWRFRRRSWPAHPACGCLGADPGLASNPALPAPRSGETDEGLTGWGGG